MISIAPSTISYPKTINLESIKFYIDLHQHLPAVPSAKEMEANGINLGKIDVLLLKELRS